MEKKDNRCSACNAEIPATILGGLCPKCLLMGGTSRDTPESRSAPGELDDDMATVSIDEEMPADFTKAAASASSFAPSQPLPLEKKGAADFAPSQEEMEKLFPDLEILNLLGAGGMGAVFKARQKRLDRLVALKVLSCPPEMHESFSLRFEREAQLLAKLLHPNIVTIFDFGEIRENGPGGLPLFYFIMEYVDGSDLAKRIRAGTISIKETLSIIPQICDALQVAHDLGITHRDVKPANMLLDSQGQVRVADFGVAKIVDNEDDLMTGLTLTGTTMGTPHYMAPEQWDAPEKVDHRSDIYSLGVIFYQMLTGERPVGRFLPPSQKVTVDPRIDEVVFKALETKRRDRYQRASEMAGEVREIAATQAANSRGGKGKAIALVLATAAAAALLTAAFRGLTNKNNGGGESIERAASVSHPQNDKNESFPAPHGSITPGRLRAAGRDTSGKPFDISEATPFNDFIDVVSQGYTWIALRKNGQTVSSDPQLIRSGITDLIWEEGSSPAFLSKDGSVEIFEQSPGLKGSTPPLSFEKTGVAQFAMGLGHGIALLRNGEVSIRGPRYERALVKGEVPDTYESGIWPPPPSNDLKNVVSVAATTTHAAALHKDGSLIAWGHSGIIDPEVYNQIHPIKTIKGSGDSFYLLTESNRIFRLRVPRSTDPNSPTGTEVRLEFVSTGTSISSTFYLSSNGAWKAFSQTENSGELLFNLPPKADLVACGHTIIKEGAPQSWLLWIEPTEQTDLQKAPSLNLSPVLPTSPPGSLRGFQVDKENTKVDLDLAPLENFTDLIQIRTTTDGSNLQIVALRSDGTIVSRNLYKNWETTIETLNHTAAPIRHLGYNTASLHHLAVIDEEGKPHPLLPDHPSNKDFPTPGENIVDVCTTETHSLMLTATGTAILWGKNFRSSPPIWPVPPQSWLSDVIEIKATEDALFLLRSNGTVGGWNKNGEIKLPPPFSRGNISAICSKDLRLIGLDKDGNAWSTNVGSNYEALANNGNPLASRITQLKDQGLVVHLLQNEDGYWVEPENISSWSEFESLRSQLKQLPNIPADSFNAGGHRKSEEKFLLWIEPSASPVPGSPLTSREADLPPALAAMKERGGRLRQWQNKSANPIDISAAENVNNFIRLTGTPLPDQSRWVAIAKSGSTISALTNFDRTGEIVALGTHNAVLNDGTLLRCWEMQRDLIPGDYLGAGYVGSSKIQFDLLLRRDGKLEMNRGPVGLSSSEWKSDELPLIRAKVAKIDDAVSINCGPNTASILRADGSVVAWLPDIGELHADPPIEKAVEIANGSNLCGALLEDGTVRVLQPPSIHPSLAKALRPPADLGKAYALRVNGRVCAAQMADGTWRAWGSDAPDLIVQINNLGPAVDILFYADKKAAEQRSLLWIEPAKPQTSTTLSPPGKLNAMGTYEDGTPIDLSKAEGINDFVKVVLQRTGWMGIRKNGTTISSGEVGERENIVDIYPAGHVSFTVKSSDRSLEILSSYDELEPKLNGEIPEEIHRQKVIDYFGLIKHYICLLEDRSVRVWGDYYDHPERLPEWANPESAWPRPPAEAAENVTSIGGGVTFAGTVTADGKLWLWDHEGMTDLGEFKKLQGDFVSLGKSTHHGTDALLNDGRILQINRKTGRFSLLENHNSPSGTANSGYRPLYQNSEGEWYTTWPTKGIEPFLETLKSRPPEEFSMNTSFIEYGPDGEKVSIGLITIDPPHAGDELSEDKANPHLGKTAGEERLFEVSPGVEIPFFWCPPGEFTMGSPEKEIGRQPDEMQHKVKLSKGYWLAKTEFTVGDWLKIPGNSPRRSQGLDPLNPITHVSWEMIAGKNGFLERIAGSAPEGWHFDLPTEAQWEYACRAGTSTMYFWETTNAKPENYKHHLYANLADVNSNKDWAMKMIDDGYGNEPAPVGTYLPNPWGFLDIVGNVNELCRDWIAAYEKDSLIDPVGPASGEEKVTRGGSYINGWADLRSATRTSIKPDFAGSPHTGFRLVLQED